MEYEFDPAKSAANRDKHGMDFVTAQALWQVPALIMPSAYPAEERWLRTARLGDRFWTAVYTQQGARIRIVSVRRARRSEVKRYEIENKD